MGLLIAGLVLAALYGLYRWAVANPTDYILDAADNDPEPWEVA